MPNIDRHKPGAFCWFELATTDQAGAKDFYTSLFAWTVNDFPMGPNEFYSMFEVQGRDAGAGYTLRPDQTSQGVPPHWMLYVAVENADDTAHRASELGAAILAAPFDVFDFGRMAVISDPTGAVFAVWQSKKHHGTGITGVDGTACWADLSTPDVEKARKFYDDLFGWKISAGEKDPSGYLHIQNGEDYIGGIPPSDYRDPNAPPHWLIYFLASDCDRFAQKAKDLAGQHLLPPQSIPDVGRMAIIKDPQGAVFALFQPGRK
jgi:uncharacterized protein